MVGTLPAPAPPSGKYLLVYKGTLGQEASQVAFASVAVPMSWDANADFSLDANPNGPWSYLEDGTLLATAVANFGIDVLDAWWNQLALPDQVVVIKNETSSTITQSTTRVLVPGLLVLDPESQTAVVSFTSPVAGKFTIQGEFTGADTGENAHPVLIVWNGAPQWVDAIVSYGDTRAFSLNLTLAVGDVLLFQVRTGSTGCTYCDLSTGFEAKISPQNSGTSGQ